MPRAIHQVFLCLALFLILFPLALRKPGWPAGLKSDEPAYYLMALSLYEDGDLRCDLGDIQRLFREFPYSQVYNLILATDDGWETVYFGKAFVYSLFAAPAAGLWGASGLLAFNMALMLMMVALGARYLSQWNSDGVSLLFSFGFFFLSCGTSYVYWIHPEVFNMAAIMVSLYLGLTDGVGEARRWVWRRRPSLRAALGGAALMLAVYNKPMLLALCLPPLYRYARSRNWVSLGAWLGGAAISGGLLVGFSMAMMGHPSAYLMQRGGQKVCSTDEMPIGPKVPVEVLESAAEDVAAVSPALGTASVVASDSVDSDSVDSDSVESDTGDSDNMASDTSESSAPPVAITEAESAPKQRPKASWYWLLRIPRPHPAAVLENLEYFFIGRHTGLFLYFPFTLLALTFFFLHGRRHAGRWVLLLSLAIVAGYFLLWIPFNWQGGGGFVGNRYYVNVYPGFLFLVTRIAPTGLNVLGFALGGLLLGPTLFSPFGRAVPSPTLQAHVRNRPFDLFPLELSLREVPGYEQRIWGGALVKGRNDVFLPRGAQMWVHGSTTTELVIQSAKPLDSLLFHVSSLAQPNEVTLRLEDAEAVQVFPAGPEGAKPQRIELKPSRASRVRRVQGEKIWVYRLEIETSRGVVRTWNRNFPPQDCFTFAYNATIQESFFVGAQMAFLGSRQETERDLYHVTWGAVEVPEPVVAGEAFSLATRVSNASEFEWPVDLPSRIGLSYRWLTPEGEIVVENGLRTYPESPLPPGVEWSVEQQVQAPATAGSYLLELDLVYEMVAWFSWNNEAATLRIPVTVTAASDDLQTLE